MSSREKVDQIKRALVSAAMDGFYPAAPIAAKELLQAAIRTGNRSEFESEIIGSLGEGNWRTVARFYVFHAFARRVSNSFEKWNRGFQPGLLNTFPGQKLIQPKKDIHPIWDAGVQWRLHFGGDTGDERVALRTDPVWDHISEFGLPFPPFDLEGYWDAEDIDRDRCESLGLITTFQTLSPVQFLFSSEILVNALRLAIRLRSWGDVEPKF